MVVRPAITADAPALHSLVLESEGALERFDDTPAAAAAAIAASEQTLAGSAAPGEEGVLLVAEEAASGRVLGCIGLTGRVGLSEPFYDYRLGRVVHSSRPLRSYRCLDVLYLCNDLTGASEAHSLYVARAARRQGLGALLARAAQLFMAAHRETFADRTIVELRGKVDAAGRSPFWEAIGRHFFRVDQRRAERLVAQGNKAFIAELMPKHPVYVSLLPETARDAVGGIHDEIRSLAALLEADGFRFESHVDIFDGGRVLECRTSDLSGVAHARRLLGRPAASPADPREAWVAAGQGHDFRAVRSTGTVDATTFATAPDTLARLRAAGDAPLLVLPDRMT
jgi:arginine N-succinyltransferase